MNSTGTWIDWQYLLDAANLLKKVQPFISSNNTHSDVTQSLERKKCDMENIVLVKLCHSINFVFPICN